MDYYEENNRDGFDGYDDGYETFGEYDDSVYAAGDGGAAELEEPNGTVERCVQGEVYDWLEAVMYALVMIFIIFTFLFRIVGVGRRIDDSDAPGQGLAYDIASRIQSRPWRYSRHYTAERNE